jgi:HEAT repeat protein
MDIDPQLSHFLQPTLFDAAAINGVVELFPAVWSAAEALSHSNPAARRAGLERLEHADAARFSPLISYLLTTRLTDPDLLIRSGIIRALGHSLLPGPQGEVTPELVRSQTIHHLAQMRTRPIYAILEAADFDSQIERFVRAIFNACPQASKQLTAILTGRNFPLKIRIQAARWIGQIGYMEAIDPLERYESRLMTRRQGQYRMAFAANDSSDEDALLPVIQDTLRILRTP